ncbi:MAG: membrane protein insertion efficiency factor YidD [Leptolyngbya sp. SIO3F4]|nr:membrane protein insertion efficiency factor YidD [Leptolyngbya sp. SIO3F4]
MKLVLKALIRGYQIFISPLFPATCRYTPSCSNYALVAVERFGPLRGTWMAIKRIFRCNPWHKGGYDPVPTIPMIGETDLRDLVISNDSSITSIDDPKDDYNS